MPILVPEKNKRPGLCYAFTPGGLELPIIDLTHPAFQVVVEGAALETQLHDFIRSQQRAGWLGKLFQRWVLPRLLKRSIIGRGLLAASGTYLSGLSTYLLKLDGENLGAGYATPLDRKIAGSVAGLLVRLRLQDLAQLLAKAVTPLLAADPTRPLHWVNVAGGPSMDSLNTLLLLWQADPSLLRQRGVDIQVLDLDSEGPGFAAAALAALRAPGGPLHGLTAALTHHPYDWTRTDDLAARLRALPPQSMVVVSSEGGLFDYGSQEQILGHLAVIHAHTPADCVVAGSLSLPDRAGQSSSPGNIAAVKPLSLETFTAMAHDTGWRVAQSRRRPNTVVFTLEKR